MFQPLFVDHFKFVNDIDVTTIAAVDTEYSYTFVEVDLKCAHGKFNNYPFQRQYFTKRLTKSVEKLVPNFVDKRRCV